VSAPELVIELDRAELSPGERVAGTVRAKSAPALRGALEVRLLWYTEGKGTQDVSTVASQPLSPSGRFEFQLPAAPHSFSGKLVSLIWAIEVEDSDSRHAHRATFVMAPERRAIALYANSPLGAGKP
jgi:hypothetical protein